MKIKPIKTEADYDAALKEIERLFHAKPGTPEEDRLDVLATLVEAYEAKHYPVPLPDPIEAIEHHMERLGLTRKDLEPCIGSRARVADILNRRRPLTLNMIRSLEEKLGIPAAVLVQKYELEPNRSIRIGTEADLFCWPSPLVKLTSNSQVNDAPAPAEFWKRLVRLDDEVPILAENWPKEAKCRPTTTGQIVQAVH